MVIGTKKGMWCTAIAFALVPTLAWGQDRGAVRGQERGQNRGGVAGTCPGDGSCFESHGNPGCNDATCCEVVCDVDGFCCSVSWDSICADEADDYCVCGGSETGSCFSTGTPWCNNADCCTAVCNVDGYCCDVEWDGICVSEANTLCKGCGAPGSGSCFESDGTPGCNDETCCEIVCGVDSFCCNNTWDSICANEADDYCVCGGSATGSCFSTGSAWCDDAACCFAVCEIDSYCCDTFWDGICVDEAEDLCLGCGGVSTGSCFTEHDQPGCFDAECCDAVCAIDSFCCNVTWDGICVDEAQDLCIGCGATGGGSCFDTDGSPGCNDANCCEAVCDQDGWCCVLAWDQFCADLATNLCLGCGQPGTGSCFAPDGTYGCNDANCCNAVCAVDSWCCSVNWDSICVSEAEDLCIGCGAPGSGPCNQADGTPGCTDADCCATVCNVDSFCCNTTWDGICVNEAQDLCGCFADLNGDNQVNGADLGLLLADWNQAGPGDLDSSGTINGADLGLLLAAWGPCF